MCVWLTTFAINMYKQYIPIKRLSVDNAAELSQAIIMKADLLLRNQFEKRHGKINSFPLTQSKV